MLRPPKHLMILAGCVGVAFSPLATGPQPTERATLKGHEHWVFAVAISPDGKTLATGSGTFDNDRGWLDGEIRLWDVASRRELATLRGHRRLVVCLAFSPDGRTLASGAEDDLVKLWDVTSRQETASFRGHADPAVPGQLSAWRPGPERSRSGRHRQSRLHPAGG
jgi:WD40 repeat protein